MKRECRVEGFFSRTPGPRRLVEVDGVWVSLDGNVVLEDVSFSLGEGRFLGLIGPNGAGKTTLLRVILGLIKPDRGTVCVMGMSPRELRHELHHVGYMPQQVQFDPLFPVSVRDVVMMGRTCCVGLFGFPSREDRKAVDESIRMVGLQGLEKRPIGELSGGQQKRAFLARALCLETRILLLDEPTAGLDIEAQSRFMELLETFKMEMGLSVLFVSHNANVLANSADEIICINRSIRIRGTAEEVLGSDRLKDAYHSEFDFLAGAGREGSG